MFYVLPASGWEFIFLRRWPTLSQLEFIRKEPRLSTAGRVPGASGPP